MDDKFWMNCPSVQHIHDRMEVLENRHPALLAGDLHVAGIPLSALHATEWLEEEKSGAFSTREFLLLYLVKVEKEAPRLSLAYVRAGFYPAECGTAFYWGFSLPPREEVGREYAKITDEDAQRAIAAALAKL